jgi:transposase
VEELDLSGIEAGYRLGGQGRAAYAPRVLVAVLLYAYAVGLRSSRRIERACVTDVALRVITVNQFPDHATIARFRARFAAELAGLFGQVLGLCVRAGLVDAAVVAVDSTKVAADAAAAANVSAAALEAAARRVLDEAEQVDAAEDACYGDRRGDEPTPGWQAGPGRRDKIRRALDELAAQHDPVQARRDAEQAKRVAQGKPRLGRRRLPADPSRRDRVETRKANRKVNLTDPQSRTMKTPRGYVQGFTAQAAAVEGQVIVAADVTNAQNDNRALKPVLEQVRRNLEAAGAGPVGTALADKGYWNANEIRDIERDGIATLVATVQGRALRDRPPSSVPDDSPMAAMTRRLSDPEQLARYRRRQAVIEPVFAHIKHNRRMDRFLRRGLQAAKDEWQLICAAYNLTKLHQAAPA